ncbi:MAG TPA: class I SAM-dependent methyltransferase [Phototrophicaceae bacterium]|jgi:SAM-dependent methyltransferase|nr:class I SAM-dependent methyltransferase [Phototrophicaceae bacterium]
MTSTRPHLDWEIIYQQSETVWGEKPDLLLMEYAAQIPMGQVLDLGMGEGRNALYFAYRGYPVRGVDLAPTAVEHCRERAQALNIPIQTEINNMLDVTIDPDSLTLAISTMCLQFVKQSEAHQIIQRIKQGLKVDGMVYLTMFSTDEPRYATLKQTDEEVDGEPNTFYLANRDTYVHFFEQSEILELFHDFQLLHVAQSISLDPGHPGVQEPHYHGILTYLGRKR